MPVREQLKALENLQEIDLKIGALQKKKAGLPVHLKNLEDAFAKSQQAITFKQNAIAEIERIQRQMHATVDLNKDRLTRAHQKLEAVQNTHEYQAASKELEQLRKMSLGLEDQMKKSKVELEAAQADLAKLTEEFEKIKTERDARLAEMGEHSGKIEGEVQILMSERGKFTPNVDSRVLASYDRVRAARGGIGLSPAGAGRCGVCNIMLPPQLFNEVQKAVAVHQCSSCSRILFVPAKAAESASSQTAGSGS